MAVLPAHAGPALPSYVRFGFQSPSGVPSKGTGRVLARHTPVKKWLRFFLRSRGPPEQRQGIPDLANPETDARSFRSDFGFRFGRCSSGVRVGQDGRARRRPDSGRAFSRGTLATPVPGASRLGRISSLEPSFRVPRACTRACRSADRALESTPTRPRAVPTKRYREPAWPRNSRRSGEARVELDSE